MSIQRLNSYEHVVTSNSFFLMRWRSGYLSFFHTFVLQRGRSSSIQSKQPQKCYENASTQIFQGLTSPNKRPQLQYFIYSNLNTEVIVKLRFSEFTQIVGEVQGTVSVRQNIFHELSSPCKTSFSSYIATSSHLCRVAKNANRGKSRV